MDVSPSEKGFRLDSAGWGWTLLDPVQSLAKAQDVWPGQVAGVPRGDPTPLSYSILLGSRASPATTTAGMKLTSVDTQWTRK
ncbi:MAG: hypothetical protein EA387_01520 [Nitriliruptor sp.]|nr:MAG: hypothetical protein EA387_01520 [Nitriliruptor sp.]